MNDPHKSRTNGESASKSRSGQRRYTVIGFSPVINSAGMKSEPAKHRITVSVKSGRILAVKVPHAESKNRSVKFASAKLTSKNCVARSGEMALSRFAVVCNPDLIT